MTALASYVEPLKREVSGPGEYDADFPSSDDGDLIGGLADAFGQAQLDGFLGTVTLDLTTYETDPDISQAAGQLLVIYAGIRILRSKLRTSGTKTLYKAGPVEYDTEFSAGVMSALLKDMEQRRKELLDAILRMGRAANSVHVTDGYLIRSQGYFPPGIPWGEFSGFFAWELGYGGIGSLL